jgi:hypothetical protein
MRGRTKAATRYTAFRNKMLFAFASEEGQSSEFVAFVRSNENLDWAFVMYCDEGETLKFMEEGPATALYQILRLADKTVLLRQLEPMSEFIWGDKGKQALYTAICVLHSVNLVDYQIRDFESSPSNTLQLTVKEDV